jgi:hypothetical protein
MTNELNTLNQLNLGDIVGDTNRMVIACHKISERVPGENYAVWVAICAKENERHPYVVWDVVARPEGFACQNGQYASELIQAVDYYVARKKAYD